MFRPAALAVLVAIVLAGCGGRPTSGPTPSPTARDLASCDQNAVGGADTPTPVPTPSDRSQTDTPGPPDAEFSQKEIPDGHWSGPLVVSATGVPSHGGGSVFNPGGGSIELTVANRQVTGGSVTFTATSTGTVTTTSGGTGTINGSGSVTTGLVSGPATKPMISGTMVQSGSISVTVRGTSFTVPLNGSVPFSALLTITEVSCTHVVATFIPDLNAKAGGGATFSGTAEWRADRT